MNLSTKKLKSYPVSFSDSLEELHHSRFLPRVFLGKNIGFIAGWQDWEPLVSFLRRVSGNMNLTHAELCDMEKTMGEKILNGDLSCDSWDS